MCNLLTSYSLSVSLNSPTLWPPGILCSWGLVNNSKWWTHLLCTYPLLMTLLRWPIGLHLKYIKIKLLRISRWQQQSLKPRVAPYRVWIPCPCTGDTSLKSSCWGRYGEGRRNSIWGLSAILRQDMNWAWTLPKNEETIVKEKPGLLGDLPPHR